MITSKRLKRCKNFHIAVDIQATTHIGICYRFPCSKVMTFFSGIFAS